MVNKFFLMLKIYILIIISSLLFVSNGFSEISVYDANGQYLGVMVGDGGYVGEDITVFIPQLELPVRFSALGDIKPYRTFSPIRFESDDCTGTPYWDFQLSAYQYIFKFGEPGHEIYYHVTDKRKSFVYKSFYSERCECIKATGSGINTYVELSVFQKKIFPFVLPIATPVYFKYKPACDAKIGLEEAIKALQIVSGVR